MRQSSSLLILLLMSVFLIGCARNGPKLDLSDHKVRKTLAGQLKEHVYKKEWAEYNCADSGYFNPRLEGDAFGKFDCTPIQKDALEAQKIRNRVVDNGVAVIDSVYGVYIRDIRKKRSIGEFLADLTEIGASTAVGITNGERAIQVIGVALTGFRAGRKSAELNLYDEKTTNVLIKRMDASRSEVLGEIKQKELKGTDEYTFDAGLTDIIRYFDAGTLNRAFTELDKETSVVAEINRLGVLRIQGLKDISRVPTIAEAQIVTDLSAALRELGRNLADATKRDVATAKLKTLYTKVAEKPEFAAAIKNLRDIAGGKSSDVLTPTTIGRLKSAFQKLDKNEELTGDEYLALVNSILATTDEDPEAGNLQKLMLDALNEIK